MFLFVLFEVKFLLEDAALSPSVSNKMMHTDIKPDAVMLVDHETQPYKVKLIDFGFAMRSSQFINGTMQWATQC